MSCLVIGPNIILSFHLVSLNFTNSGLDRNFFIDTVFVELLRHPEPLLHCHSQYYPVLSFFIPSRISTVSGPRIKKLADNTANGTAGRLSGNTDKVRIVKRQSSVLLVSPYYAMYTIGHE
jgi:hypothetical protein